MEDFQTTLLGLLVDEKITMSRQHALAAQKAKKTSWAVKPLLSQCPGVQPGWGKTLIRFEFCDIILNLSLSTSRTSPS